MPFVSINLEVVARLAAIGLLNSVVLGSWMVAIGWLVVRLAGRSSSRNRFALWYLALIGIALLPWVGCVAAASSATHPTLSPGYVTLPVWLVDWLVGAWVVGAVLGLAHVAHGLYRLRQLRSRCIPVQVENLDPVVRESLLQAMRWRSVQLCVSNSVGVPAAIGYVRPIIVLPKWTLAEMPLQELNAILLHELAHLRRYDDWTNLAQKLVRALFFFHPAVWFIESRLTLEREMACDDAVLSAELCPRAYAKSLVGLAEKSLLRRGVQLAQAAVGHLQQLKLRLVEILRKDRPQGTAKWAKPALATICLAALVGTYVAASSPRWISFSGNPGGEIAHAVQPNPDASIRPVKLVIPAESGIQPVPRSAAQPLHRAAELIQSARVAEVLHPAMNRQMVEPEPIPPQLILSGMSPQLAAHPIFLVFQGDAVGPDGAVWRVTVFHILSAQYVAFSGAIPKQI